MIPVKPRFNVGTNVGTIWRYLLGKCKQQAPGGMGMGGGFSFMSNPPGRGHGCCAINATGGGMIWG